MTPAAPPEELVATAPPEERGLPRDEVALVVTTPARTEVGVFTDLVDALDPHDLLVVNTSATLPAALPVADGGRLHLSTPDPGAPSADRHALPDVAGVRRWVVEARHSHGWGTRPDPDRRAGEVLALPCGATATLLRPYRQDARRLWVADLDVPGDLLAYLDLHGSPIRYAYTSGDWPLAAYQTTFAREPGSAEMPSAGRPFSARVLRELRRRGVGLAPITLHTGVSSPESHEPPYPEPFRVPASTARAVAATRRRGGRVIAVGTTVTRALESLPTHVGAAGWTDLVLGPERPAQVVDGIISGLHPAGASHLQLLEAVAGPDVVARTYAAAHEHRLLWHEFGDSTLLLRR